jgi:hypothetical protein
MKKKELIKKIQNQALDQMPDVLSRIDLDSIQVEENYESIKRPFNLRRAFTYTFASLFILVSGFMIYNFGFLSLVNDANPLETETEIIGFQTVSAASLLSVTDITELNSYDSSYSVIKLNQSTSFIEDEIELIADYMSLAETVIGNEQNYLYTEVDSDKPSYQYAFEYKGSDLVGNLIVYNAYYNKSTSSNGEEIISGIMIHNQNEYNFTSSEVSIDNILTYRYRVYTNGNNYVEVINISNDDYQRFEYNVYQNGNLSNSSEVTIKSNYNNIQATMLITKNNNQLSLEFERNTEDFDNQEMQVSYSYNRGNNVETGEFNVNLVSDGVTGEYKYQYQFGNDNTLVTDRTGKGNSKASEDDFIPAKGNQNSNQTSTISTEEEDTTPGHNSGNTSNGNKQNSTKKSTIKMEI